MKFLGRVVELMVGLGILGLLIVFMVTMWDKPMPLPSGGSLLLGLCYWLVAALGFYMVFDSFRQG